MAAIQTIDGYIAQYDASIQTLLQNVRKAVRAAAPEAAEKIAYGIPTLFFAGENLVHFAAFKHHIGFYPTSSGVEAFRDKLKAYRTSRGAIQFPYTQPVPYALITEITAFRVVEASRRNR